MLSDLENYSDSCKALVPWGTTEHGFSVRSGEFCADSFLPTISIPCLLLVCVRLSGQRNGSQTWMKLPFILVLGVLFGIGCDFQAEWV